MTLSVPCDKAVAPYTQCVQKFPKVRKKQIVSCAAPRITAASSLSAAHNLWQPGWFDPRLKDSTEILGT